jgi:SAM-dependent methyltransferase
MAWSEYEKWSFSLVKDVLAHIQFLFYSIIFGISRRALEIGSGTGLQSSFVSYFGIEVISVDRDPKIALMARKVSRYYNAKNLGFVVADASFLPFKKKVFSVSFSQGLLEHLDNQTLFSIVSEAKRTVKGKILFSVPSVNFPEQDFGNERLLLPAQWDLELEQFCAKASYYRFDFQSFKYSVLNRKVLKPWHIQIDIPSN